MSDASADETLPDLDRRLEAAARRAGLVITSATAIEAGLGSRRFFRLHFEDGPVSTAIARVDAPEDDALRPAGVPPEPPLEPIRAFLERADVPVPHCYVDDRDGGVALLEDLGDDSLESLSRNAPREVVVRRYGEACRIASTLQRLSAPQEALPAFQRRLDEALFRYKAEQVVEWTLPHCAAAGAGAPEVVREAFAAVASECARAPQRLSHRDFKAANLMLRGDALVLIDLQGALLAPPEYDFVCLLRDSHVELAEETVQSLLERIRPELPDAPAPDEFDRRFTLLTLTRVGKDLSRYLYAAHTRNDRRYLAFVPTAIRNLRRAAQRAASQSAAYASLAEILGSLPDSIDPTERA